MTNIEEAIIVIRKCKTQPVGDLEEQVNVILDALAGTQSKLALAEQRLAKVETVFTCSNERTPQGNMDWWASGDAILIGPTFLEAVDSINLPPVRKEKG